MSQEDRSEALIEVLEQIEQSNIEFVLVGGYAISQFETRFSTDLDLVIAPNDRDEVVAFLEARQLPIASAMGLSVDSRSADIGVSDATSVAVTISVPDFRAY